VNEETKENENRNNCQYILHSTPIGQLQILVDETPNQRRNLISLI
jgi:hypothetical protein